MADRQQARKSQYALMIPQALMRNVARLPFLLLGIIFVVAVISHSGNTPRTDMTTAGSPPQVSAAPVVMPAVPTNTYLTLPPDDLFAHARGLAARMYDANRPNPKIGGPLIRKDEVAGVSDALSAIPKSSPHFKTAQQLLALVKRRTEEGEHAEEAYVAKETAHNRKGYAAAVERLLLEGGMDAEVSTTGPERYHLDDTLHFDEPTARLQATQ